MSRVGTFLKKKETSECKSTPTKYVVRPTFGLIGLLALAGAVSAQRMYIAGSAAVGITLGAVIVAWVMFGPSRQDQQRHYWLSTAFSGATAGAITGLATLLAPSIFSTVLCAVAATLALMASLTGFCAGRIAYVLLFRVDQSVDTACSQ
jgi:hypothetical protein